ncbi:MAG: hypothetical protein N2Z22_02695 [Turneriella sp.]|nr:hypothetical protein [Leptospiraceae bacterium]MCX7632225.1 hypothetical protein [Turneriella sp.]
MARKILPLRRSIYFVTAFSLLMAQNSTQPAQNNTKPLAQTGAEPALLAQADTLAEIDREIAESEATTAQQTQITQQALQIVTVDRSSMPNILAAVDMVLEKGLAGNYPAFDGLLVRSTEFGFFGAIDWFANGMLLFAFHREGNNYSFAVHEATFEFPSLPWNLWARIGRMFPDAGRLNTIHLHDRPFTSIPRVHGQLFDTVIGEGFLDTGGELAWLTPLPFFSEIKLGIFNGRTFGHTHSDGFPKASPLFLLRQKNFFAFAQGFGLQVGWTYLRYTVSTDPGDVDQKWGADITLKYQRGRWESFELSGEFWYHRENRVALIPEDKAGFYAYFQYQPLERWKFGYRRDFFVRYNTVNPLTGRRGVGADHGDAFWLCYLTSEFFNFKINAERQRWFSETRDIWLIYAQAVYVLGFHPAHRF